MFQFSQKHVAHSVRLENIKKEQFKIGLEANTVNLELQMLQSTMFSVYNLAKEGHFKH